MKPFEFGSKQKTNFPDFHVQPKKEFMNWWEDRNYVKSKQAKRAILKKELKKEIDEYEQDN